MNKIFITANDLLEDAFKLAVKIHLSGFRPDFIVGVWRGGTPVAMAVQEYFEYKGIHTEHTAIRAASYTGINERTHNVAITGLEYIFNKTSPNDKILVVDDVFDTGNSFKAILNALAEEYEEGIHDRVKTACPWYKPANNQTDIVPDFYLHKTDSWLVFPHELKGLTENEIIAGKPAIGRIIV